MSRDEWDDYWGDVVYDTWRSGGNPDAVDWDRCHDRYYEGRSVESCVAAELRIQRRAQERAREERAQAEEYYRQMAEEYKQRQCGEEDGEPPF
jgi:hypothetical protein